MRRDTAEGVAWLEQASQQGSTFSKLLAAKEGRKLNARELDLGRKVVRKKMTQKQGNHS